MAHSSSGRELYLDLLKRSVTNWLYLDAEDPPGLEESRAIGFDWPPTAHTMVGLKRLDALQGCIEDVLQCGVPGDLIETGVWRGGACIFMRGVLRAYDVRDRVVWAADSFDGLPRPDPGRFPADEGDTHWTEKSLSV